MHTNIDIDDDLIAKAMVATGLTTTKATVEEALRRLVRHQDRRNAVADMAGLGWEGDLATMRNESGPEGWSGSFRHWTVWDYVVSIGLIFLVVGFLAPFVWNTGPGYVFVPLGAALIALGGYITRKRDPSVSGAK
jgi:Arc/MetJ family transcription regulator